MKIVVGSKNPIKVSAVEELLRDYDFLREAEVSSTEVASGVSEQPKSTEETVRGAANRAKAAFTDCDFSFGIESGLMRVPHTKTGHMDFTACAIYDGKSFYFGLSSAWETPEKVANYMLRDGLDMNEAFFKAGFTNNRTVGSAEGAIGVMTKGRVTRKEYTKQAIQMALIHLEDWRQ